MLSRLHASLDCRLVGTPIRRRQRALKSGGYTEVARKNRVIIEARPRKAPS